MPTEQKKNIHMQPNFYVRLSLPALMAPLSVFDPENETMSGLHLVNLVLRYLHDNGGTPYALGFPSIFDKNTHNFATIVVYTGTREDLAKILDITPIRRLLRDHFTVTPIRPVPLNVTEWVRYSRSRREDRLSPSVIKRILRKGKKGTPFFTAVQDLASKVENPEVISSILRHRDKNREQNLYFQHRSKTTGETLAVYFKGEKCSSPGRFEFNRLGLAVKGSAVPLI